MNLEKLFNPKSVAVIGASKEEGKVGNTIAKNLLELGYGGEVYLVNPKYGEIFGKRCYKSLAEIKNNIDLAILAIPAESIVGEIRNNADKIKNYVVISSGFSEIGKEGEKREKELKELAKNNQLNILGPNCLGFIVPKLKINASFAGGMAKSGNISFVTQSGALAVALLDMAEKEELGFSNIVSIGNKMEIAETEMLKFLANDKDTKVIGLYLESIKNNPEFIRMTQEVGKIKPIIILKAGKNKKTQRAIASHTGALAGTDDIISAVLNKAGAVRADNFEEFFNLLGLISHSRNIPGKKSVVITNAGGAGVLTADAFGEKSIQLVELSEEIKKKLKNNLPAESSVENPIDLLGDAREDRYRKTLEIVSKIEEPGSIIVVLTPQDQTPVEKIADAIIEFEKKTNKLIAAVFLGGARIDKAIRKLKKNGVYNFNFPDLAVTAIDNYYKWDVFRKLEVKTENRIVDDKRKEETVKIIAMAKAENRSALYFSEAAAVMGLYGVNTLPALTIEARDEITGKIVYPLALKVDSDKVLHKTDEKALILDIKNENELNEARELMKLNFPRSRLIIQPMAEKGMEIIIGVKRDPVFGPIILCGLGGVYTEFLKIADYLVPPLNTSEVAENLIKGKLNFLFQGVRGQKRYDIEELARILIKISHMAVEISEIKGFDINPLLIYNDGRKAMALDVKIII